MSVHWVTSFRCTFSVDSCAVSSLILFFFVAVGNVLILFSHFLIKRFLFLSVSMSSDVVVMWAVILIATSVLTWKPFLSYVHDEMCVWHSASYVYKASLLLKVIIGQDKWKLFSVNELLVFFFFNWKHKLFCFIRWWKVPDQWWSQTRAFGLSWSNTSRSWRAGGQQAAVWASLHLKTKQKTLHVKSPLYLLIWCLT